MAEEEDSKRDQIIDIASAVVLGITTAFAAYGAFQSALWGGNQATAYTAAINTLGEANRELLRGVQERSFDTTIWIEHVKASQPSPAAPEPEAKPETDPAAPGAAPAPTAAPAASPVKPAAEEEEEEEKPQTPEERAAEIADSLTEVEDAPVAKKLDKLLATRRELTAALKWADEQHARTTKAMPKGKRLELARELVALDDKQQKIAEDQYALLEKLQVAEGTDEEIDAALAGNADVKGQMTKLDEEFDKLQQDSDKLLDKLAKPLFFESNTYSNAQERPYLELVQKGNKLFEDGQNYNKWGDNFALATVFHTVALFFAGLSAVLRRFPLKLAFLIVGTIIAIGATVYMFKQPLA